jgi:hypothetical protein
VNMHALKNFHKNLVLRRSDCPTDEWRRGSLNRVVVPGCVTAALAGPPNNCGGLARQLGRPPEASTGVRDLTHLMSEFEVARTVGKDR